MANHLLAICQVHSYNMSLSLNFKTLPDPDGHNPALKLKGDWLFVGLSDGEHIGVGEASHSQDDGACQAQMEELFAEHLSSFELSLENIQQLEKLFTEAHTLVRATAISALNQALYDLLAKQQGIPVWQLLAPEPNTRSLRLYATINRALSSRTQDDYLYTLERATFQGFGCIKCAPFEAVTSDGDQVAAAQEGLERLWLIRQAYPELKLRVDFHERFHTDAFLEILPQLEPLSLDWLEVPCPIGPAYRTLKQHTLTPIAAGEFFFGSTGFVELAAHRWADVVMPDVKHVGGFGPLLAVCEALVSYPVSVSPHNPSGPISTLASLHAGVLASNVSSLEVPLSSGPLPPLYWRFVHGDQLYLPDAPGWGIGWGELGD